MNDSGDYGFCQMCGAQTRQCRLLRVADVTDVPSSSSIEKLVFYFRILKSESLSKDHCSTSECIIWQHDLNECICLECTNVLSVLMQFTARKAQSENVAELGCQHEGKAPDNVEQSTETSKLFQAVTEEKLRLFGQPNPLQASSCSFLDNFQHNKQHHDLLLHPSSESTVTQVPSPSKLLLNNETKELQKIANTANKSSTDSTGEMTPVSPKLNQTRSPLQLSRKRIIHELELNEEDAINTSPNTADAKKLTDYGLKKIVSSTPAKHYNFKCVPDLSTSDMVDSDPLLMCESSEIATSSFSEDSVIFTLAIDQQTAEPQPVDSLVDKVIPQESNVGSTLLPTFSFVNDIPNDTPMISTNLHDISSTIEYSDGSLTSPRVKDCQTSVDQHNKEALKGILKNNNLPSPRSSRSIQFDPVKSIRLIFDEESSSESDNELQNDNTSHKTVSKNTRIKPNNVATDKLDGSLHQSVNSYIETESSERTEKITVSLPSKKKVHPSFGAKGKLKRKFSDLQDFVCTDEVLTDKSCEDVSDVAMLDLNLPTASIDDNDMLKSTVDTLCHNSLPTKTVLKAKRHHPVKNLGLRNVKGKVKVSDSSDLLQSSIQMKSPRNSLNLSTLKIKSKRNTDESKALENTELSQISNQSKLDTMPNNGNLIESQCVPDLPKTMFELECLHTFEDFGNVKDVVQKLRDHVFNSYVDMGVRCDQMLPSVNAVDSKKSVPLTKGKYKEVAPHISSKSKKRKI